VYPCLRVTKLHPNAATIAVKREPKTRLIGVRHLDGRTRAAARARKLVATFEAELANGGILTAQTRIAAERAATLVVLAEDARARRLAGDTKISLEDVVRMDNVAARAIKALGLGRRRPGRPAQTLGEYLAREGAP